MSLPIIEVDNLSKCYRLGAIGATSLRETANRWWDRARSRAAAAEEKDFWALRDVSFTVQSGEVVGIIGRNGAGKSTLLKILSRITEPTSGRAIMRGRVASLLEVGTGFHPELTGRENIFLNGAILGMTRPEVRRKFDEIVDFADVAQFIDTPVKRYSSGMYVRLAFAVAAHLEPEILIIDEVLSVGDAQFQKKSLGKMHDVAATEGRTVLFVSHNVGAIHQLCSKGVVLRQGMVQFSGNVAQALDFYLSDTPELGSSELKNRKLTPGKPYFIDTWFEDENGKRTDNLVVSQLITLCITWQIPKRLPGLRVGCGLNDQLGNRIFGSVPEDTGSTTPAEAGIHTARIRFPENLFLPKSYTIDLCLWIPGAETFEFLQSARTFTLQPGASQILAVDPNRAGQIQFYSQWRIDSS